MSMNTIKSSLTCVLLHNISNFVHYNKSYLIVQDGKPFEKGVSIDKIRSIVEDHSMSPEDYDNALQKTLLYQELKSETDKIEYPIILYAILGLNLILSVLIYFNTGKYILSSFMVLTHIGFMLWIGIQLKAKTHDIRSITEDFDVYISKGIALKYWRYNAFRIGLFIWLPYLVFLIGYQFFSLQIDTFSALITSYAVTLPIVFFYLRSENNHIPHCKNRMLALMDKT